MSSDLSRQTRERQAAAAEPIQLTIEKQVDGLGAALAGRIGTDRFIRAAVTSFRTSPALQRCSRESILGGLFVAAQLGLEIGGPRGLAYLVPYGKDAQLVLGYRGLLELGYRSGQVKTVDAFLIREGDTFRKRWDPDRGLVFDWEPMSDDAPPVGAIAFVVTTQGGLLWEHMTKEQILARRPERWQGTPWASWPDPMWLKTVLKSLYKRVRLSADDNSLSLAVESDETVQRRVDVPGMEPEYLVEHVPVAGSRPAVEPRPTAPPRPATPSPRPPERPRTAPPAPARQEAPTEAQEPAEAEPEAPQGDEETVEEYEARERAAYEAWLTDEEQGR